MYAIAIHERVQNTVTLSRDPFGIKPLYTAQVSGGLAFASEPQALLEAGLVARKWGTLSSGLHRRRDEHETIDADEDDVCRRRRVA